MASEASNIVRLQPRHDKRGNVSYFDEAVVIDFPKEARPADSFAAHLNYMDAWTEFNCQAALVTASFVALYFKALGVSRLHVHQHERGASSCRTERQGQKMAPDEGQ